MVRGTTPTHVFTLPFDVSVAKNIKITYAQNNKVVFVKRSDDCVLDGKTISVTLTQEETFMFDIAYNVQIQLRILTRGESKDNALITKVYKIPVEKCLDGEVLK